MYAHDIKELLWVFGTAFALGLGWSLGCWLVRKLLG